MSRRALQFASLFLLLASMGPATDAAAHGAPVFAAPYVRILMAHQAAAQRAAARGGLVVRLVHAPVLAASVGETIYVRRVWTQASPVSAAIGVRAVSASGL